MGYHKNISDQTLRILETGGYWETLREDLDRSVSSSRLYTPTELALKKVKSPQTPSFHFLDENAQQAAFRFKDKDPMILNFASAKNPGGGFVRGTLAQEEDLCMCSGLYLTLLPHRQFYEANRECSSTLYTDYLIYSPFVPFFRLSYNKGFQDQLFYAAVVSSPAPNMNGNKTYSTKEVYSTFLQRWRRVLEVSKIHGHKTLVLGAWGCGVFRNDPALVAFALREAIRQTDLPSSQIVFACPDFRLLNIFTDVLLKD